jgi:hypothetical protein
LSSGQEKENLTGDRERGRRESQRGEEGKRNRFGLDIDIWGIPMQLEDGVHAPVGWKYVL